MHTRHNIFLIGCALVIVSALVSAAVLAVQFKETNRLRQHVAKSAIEERLGNIFAAMNDFPGSAGKDMLFLRSLASVATLYDEFSAKQWRLAHNDLQQFIDRNSAYDEIHVRTDLCMFAARRIIEESGDTSCESLSQSLEDVISHTLAQKDGSVYISPLIAHTRSVLGKEGTIPAIMYGTKVSAPGNTDGVLVAVVNADYFLEEIRRLKREGETVYLVGADGSYLAHPEREKERISGGNANFYEDFSEVNAGILGDTSVRRLEAGGKTFTFLRITPTMSNFALYDDANPALNGYWVMVAISENVADGAWWFSRIFLSAIFAIFMIHGLLMWFLRIALLPVGLRAERPSIPRV